MNGTLPLTLYYGNSFNVERTKEGWRLYRFTDDDEQEQITLDTEAMDELRDYFAEYYAEDKLR